MKQSIIYLAIFFITIFIVMNIVLQFMMTKKEKQEMPLYIYLLMTIVFSIFAFLPLLFIALIFGLFFQGSAFVLGDLLNFSSIGELVKCSLIAVAYFFLADYLIRFPIKIIVCSLFGKSYPPLLKSVANILFDAFSLYVIFVQIVGKTINSSYVFIFISIVIALFEPYGNKIYKMLSKGDEGRKGKKNHERQ